MHLGQNRPTRSTWSGPHAPEPASSAPPGLAHPPANHLHFHRLHFLSSVAAALFLASNRRIQLPSRALRRRDSRAPPIKPPPLPLHLPLLPHPVLPHPTPPPFAAAPRRFPRSLHFCSAYRTALPHPFSAAVLVRSDSGRRTRIWSPAEQAALQQRNRRIS